MKTFGLHVAALTTIIASTATPALAQDELQLIITSPQPRSTYFPDFESIQYRSGWELEILLRAPLVNGSSPPGPEVIPEFPEAGVTSALIFEDGDGCPSLGGDGPTLGLGACPVDTGERYLIFTPDRDHTGVTDAHGLADMQAELADQDNWPLFGGPDLTEGAVTGIGYGPNDDLPGLVLMSNVGVGIVYNLEVEECNPADQVDNGSGPECPTLTEGFRFAFVTDWSRPANEARYNLAGLMDRVAFELGTQWGFSEVRTSLAVPRNLFSHVAIHDICYLGVGNCDGRITRLAGVNRVDAGPISNPANGVTDVDIALVELRAVVVNGRAPAIIEDCDGDGQVTAADLELACNGSRVLLSNEAVVEFEHWGQLIEDCNNLDDPWTAENDGSYFIDLDDILSGGTAQGANLAYADFDGNTFDGVGVICPIGGGGTLRPPR